MGHERLGLLPKTKRWRAIVAEIAAMDAPPSDVPEIARRTLDALGSRYVGLASDKSVETAFAFLVPVRPRGRSCKPPRDQRRVAGSLRNCSARGSGCDRDVEQRQRDDSIGAIFGFRDTQSLESPRDWCRVLRTIEAIFCTTDRALSRLFLGPRGVGSITRLTGQRTISSAAPETSRRRIQALL